MQWASLKRDWPVSSLTVATDGFAFFFLVSSAATSNRFDGAGYRTQALFADSKGSVCLSSIGAAAIDAAVAAGLGEVLVEQALQDTQVRTHVAFCVSCTLPMSSALLQSPARDPRASLGARTFDAALFPTLSAQTALLSSFRAFWLRIGERLRAYQDELDHDGASGSGALSPDATQPSVFLDGNLEWVSPLVREGIPALSAESDRHAHAPHTLRLLRARISCLLVLILATSRAHRCCARCAAVADRIAAGHPPAALSLQALARRTVQVRRLPLASPLQAPHGDRP